jgi:Mce-associated membrane protein
MAETQNQPDDAARAKADALALAEQAEAEAAEAEALAAAARARARAIRLRRQAEAETDTVPADTAETTAAAGPTAATAEPADTGPATARPAEPAVAATEPTRRRGPGRIVSTALTVAGILAICGLLGASGYMIWYHHHADARRQQETAFVAAARQGVVNMTSLDYKKAKQDVQRVIDSSTGEFKDDFEKRAGDFTKVVEESQVVTEGAVKATAVESMDKDSAVILVLGAESVTNAAGAKDEPRSFRLRVVVARDGDQIKMSKVEFVL